MEKNVNKEQYNTISISQFQKEITEKLFQKKLEQNFNATPATLLDWAKQDDLKISIVNIDNWDLFEQDKIDFDESDFSSLLFSQELDLKDEIVFLSDDLIKNQIAYRIKVSEFESFAQFYQQKFGQEFFQPLDYIIYFVNSVKLKIIHHEGKLVNIHK